MNLDNVKYTWFLTKFKDGQIEVSCGNAGTLSNGQLARAMPIMQRELQKTRIAARKEVGAKKVTSGPYSSFKLAAS